MIGRDGLPVTDLTRDDFEVREDDVVQRIQVFEHRTLTGYPARDDESLAIRSADHARQEAGREEVRLLVLFLDDYHIRFGPLEDHQLRQRLVRFVTTEMRPLDLFAVMGPLTPISDLGLTRDEAALLRRINTLQGRLGGFVPPRSKLEEGHLSLGGADLMRVRAQVSLSALQSLVVHLGSLREGRKSVLFVSQGPAMYIGGYDMSDDLRDVIASANRNNVTIHTLDPRELGQASMISEINNALSIDTGGRRIGLTNDFSPALRGVMSDASDYYLLGYESPQVKPDGKFHDIDVRVRRKGVRVIARNGYWSPSPEEANTANAATAAPPIPPEVSEALGALRDATRRVSVLDWVGVSPLDGGASRVSITFEPVTADPRLVPASVHVDVTLPGGATSTHAANPAADGTWQLEITSPPGRVTVRPAVKDGAGEVIDTWSRTGRRGSRRIGGQPHRHAHRAASADGLAVSRHPSRRSGAASRRPSIPARRSGDRSPAARPRRSAAGRCAAPEP